MHEHAETKDAVETREGREAGVGEWAVQHEKVRFGVTERHQIVPRVATLPRFEYRVVVKEGRPSSGTIRPVFNLPKLTFARRALTAPSPVGVPSKLTFSS